MKTPAVLSVLVLLVCGTYGYAQSNKSSPAAAALSANDIAAIRAGSKTYERAGNARDWPRLIALFTDDIVFMPPNAPVTSGRKDVEAMLHAYPTFKDLQLEPVDIEGRGDLAFARGRYSLAMTPPGQPEQPDSGKYIEIWRKQPGGAWKYARGIFNSDRPSLSPARGRAPAARPPIPAAAEVTSHSLSAHEVAAIRQAWSEFMQTINAKAWVNYGRSITPDFILMPANQPMQRGERAAIEWGQAFPPYRDWRAEPLEIEGSSDLAYIRGQWSVVIMPPGQPEFADAGKYVQIWRRQPDGAWKLARDIFNSDLPAAPPVDPWIGRWELNVAKSKFTPGPAPRSEVRAYTATTEGERADYITVEADGREARSHSIYKYDGKDVPVPGSRDTDLQSLQRTGPTSIAGTIKKDGKVVRTATRTVSSDGNVLTVAFKGVNAKGQPLDDVWVFDRRPDPWLGMWELDRAQSRIAPRVTPRFELRTFASMADGEHATYVSIETDGSPVRSEASYRFDGRDHPVSNSMPGTTIAFTRAGALGLAFTVRANGRVVRTGTREASADGKRLTVTVKHADTARADDVWVFERRGTTMARDDVIVAVKNAVTNHWAFINGADSDGITKQHTLDVTLFAADFDPRIALYSPQGLAIIRRWQGAKTNWKIRDLDVQPLGAAAVATFHMDGSIQFADGTIDSRPRRVTEVWVNENGAWKEAHHHDSVYTPAAMRPAASSQ